MMSLAFDRSSLEEKLATAASDVLETMFFTSVEDADSEAERLYINSQTNRIGASLDFHGACRGRLALSLEREAAQGLAMNFFGSCGPDGTEEDCRNVVAELTNMVCGAMLSHLDRKSIFCLDSPKELPMGEEAVGEVIRDLRLDNGLLRLAFSLEELDEAAGH